jgi:hypothetical protein
MINEMNWKTGIKWLDYSKEDLIKRRENDLVVLNLRMS